MFPNTADTLLRTIVRAQEGSDYIDAEGFWESGNHAGVALRHDLEVRGYVLIKRNFAGAEIGVKPTVKGLRFARRVCKRIELLHATQDAARAMDAIPAGLRNNNYVQDSCWRIKSALQAKSTSRVLHQIQCLRNNISYIQAQRQG